MSGLESRRVGKRPWRKFGRKYFPASLLRDGLLPCCAWMAGETSQRRAQRCCAIQVKRDSVVQARAARFIVPLLDADFVEQLSETGLGTQRIGDGIHTEVGQVIVALPVGALEAVESIALFAEAQLNGGNVK